MNHPLVKQIKDLLDSNSIPYEYLEHAPVITSEEASEIRKEYSLSEGGKALILKIDKESFIQVVITGDSKFSNSKLRKAINAKDIQFASPEELEKITDGVLPGAVPPFGNLFGLKVYVDEKVLKNKRIVFNCGSRSASIGMKVDDYINLVNPIVLDISK